MATQQELIDLFGEERAKQISANRAAAGLGSQADRDAAAGVTTLDAKAAEDARRQGADIFRNSTTGEVTDASGNTLDVTTMQPTNIQRKVEEAKRTQAQAERERDIQLAQTIPTAEELLAQEEQERARILGSIQTRAVEAGQQAAQKSAGEVGALRTSFAQGRNGAQTSSAQQIAGRLPDIQSQRQEDLVAADPELARRKALLSQSEQRASRLRELVRDTKIEDAVLAELKDIEEGFSTKQLEAAQDQLSFLQDNPGALLGMSDAGLADILSSAGIPSSGLVAKGLKEQVKAVQEAEEQARKSKSDADLIALDQARVDLAQSIQEAQTAGQTANEKTIAGFRRLLNDGVITQEQFNKAVEEEIGVAEKQESALDIQLKKADLAIKNAQTDQEKLKAYELKYNLQQQGALEAGGIDIINTVSRVENNADADSVYNSLGLTRYGSQDAKGQCGAFVNDILKSAGRYGDSFASKYARINETNPLNPTAGAVFISRRGNTENGHVGFVESVNGDGTVTLADMNRYGSGKFNRRTVAISELANVDGEFIVGYENTAVSGQSGSLSEGDESDTLVGRWRQQAKKLGITSKKDVDEYVQNKIEEASGDMNDTQAKSFTAYSVVERENALYDSLISDAGLTSEEFASAIDYIDRAIAEGDDLTDDLIREAAPNETVQRALMSEKRWIEAVLRKESGAAISAAEYLNKGVQNFPRPGDTAKTVADKRNARIATSRGLYESMGASGQAAYFSAQEESKPKEMRIIEDESVLANMQEWIQSQLAAGVSPNEINAQLEAWDYDPSQF